MFEKVKNILYSNPYFICDDIELRGSFAFNSNHSDSDLDIIIISNDFSGIDLKTRKLLVEKALIGFFDIKVDPICITKIEHYKIMNTCSEVK